MANRSQLNGQAELFCFGIFRAFQSFRRQFKRPRDNERDGKPDNDCEHDKAHCPIRNFEKRKNLGGNLNGQPTDDRVHDRDFVNVAPLQLGEEVADSSLLHAQLVKATQHS